MAVSGNSLLRLVTALLAELGPSQEFAATDSVTPTVVTSSTMADSEAAAERYGGYYLYCTTDVSVSALAGQQQRVKRNGFTGSTGSFTVAAAFTGNTAASSRWLLSGTMPIIDQDALVGVRTCVNRAIRKTWIVDRYEISATTGQYQYDLTPYWMARKRVIRLLDPEDAATGHMDPATQGWRIIPDGETWTLELDQGYATGETFALVVERPANSRLYISGAWAEQSSPTAGLVIGLDACLGEWNTIFQASLYECYAALANQAGGARKSYWREKLEEQRNVVSMIKLFEADKESVTLGEGSSDAPGTWSNVSGDHGFWSN